MLPNWLYGKSKSKLAELLGGGGTPSDYNQVKAQVTQNTEDITLLNSALDAKVDWDDYSELGAVNLASNNLVTQTVSQANFTITHNADGSITVYSDGVTASWSIDVCDITIKAGTYRLKGTGTDDVKFQIVDNPVVHQLYAAGANDVIMTFATDTAIKLRASVFNGKSYDNIVIYPMITPASYTGPYVPYAMTNRELTSNIATLDSSINSILNSTILPDCNQASAIFARYNNSTLNSPYKESVTEGTTGLIISSKNSAMGTTYITQIAIPDGIGHIYTRTLATASWTSWALLI